MPPISNDPVANNNNNTYFMRAVVARALALPPTTAVSAFDTTADPSPLAEENNKAPEGAPKSAPASNDTLALNRKRRASALESRATNVPQHCSRTRTSIANEKELEDYNEDERNGSGSDVAGPPTQTNELEDYHEENLSTASDASLPPTPKKHCTGLQDQVLVIDGETFLLPEGRGDVTTLEPDEAIFGRFGNMVHPKIIVIDGQRFLLPRGGGEIVALGQDKHEQSSKVNKMEQRELGYIGFEEEDCKDGQETDPELDSWFNNYYCYLESRAEGSLLQDDDEEEQKEWEGTGEDDLNQEEPGNSRSADVEEGDQTTQSDTTESSMEKQLCMHCGQHHLLDDEEDATEQSDSDHTEPDYPHHWFDYESDEQEEVYDDEDEQAALAYLDADLTSDIDSDDAPPSDSGYDSKISDTDDSDSSDSSDSDSSSDDSIDYDDYGGNDTTGQAQDTAVQAPAVAVDGPICYGPTDLPEGHVRGDMMFVLNGELWGIDFTN